MTVSGTQPPGGVQTAIAQAIAPPLVYNGEAWRSLPDVSRDAQGIEAVLLEFDLNGSEEKPAWKFLVNPRSLRWRDAAEYTAILPHASRAAHRHYGGSAGATLVIPDLSLNTYYWGKSVTPLIEGARELLKAKPAENLFSPPLLVFRLGALRFGPCLLESVEWDESAWLGGERARVNMSLTLVEVIKPLTEAEKEERERQRQEAEADRREAQGLPRVPLLENQRQAASTAAREYLEAHKSEWSDEVQALIQAGRYSLQTDPNTGDVAMLDGSRTVGIILRSTGREFRTGSTFTTIPRAGTATGTAPTPAPTTTTPAPSTVEAHATTTNLNFGSR